MKRIIIRNCRVIDPVTETDKKADIIIEDGVIKYLQACGRADGPEENRYAGEEDTRVIEGKGMTAIPGLMDTHVHFRDPGFTEKEDLLTGAAAAARGGVTRVVCMANTKPVVDTVEVLEDILQRGRQTGIRIHQAASITMGLRGKELTDMQGLYDAGAVLFTDDGIPLMDEALLVQAMEKAAELDVPLALHEEDPLFVPGAGVNASAVADRLGYPGAFSAAEEVLTARDCMLALHTGASVCIQHISSAASVELVRTAKKLGADIHAEATPHHFTLTEEAVLKYGTNARMNPPLRTQRDRLAIIEGLADGTIDMIVTDHAPHTAQEKSAPLEKAPSGIIGLETSLGLGIQSLVHNGPLQLMDLVRLMSTNPARFVGMEPASIAPGKPADLVLLKENEEWVVDHFVSKASNSPFLGWKLPGKIHLVLCDGRVVYEAAS